MDVADVAHLAGNDIGKGLPDGLAEGSLVAAGKGLGDAQTAQASRVQCVWRG